MFHVSSSLQRPTTAKQMGQSMAAGPSERPRSYCLNTKASWQQAACQLGGPSHHANCYGLPYGLSAPPARLKAPCSRDGDADGEEQRGNTHEAKPVWRRRLAEVDPIHAEG